MGAGLIITKHLSRIMGGDVDVSSVEGEGTRLLRQSLLMLIVMKMLKQTPSNMMQLFWVMQINRCPQKQSIRYL